MFSATARQPAEHYRTTQLATQVSEASPHQLISLLLNGASRQLRLATISLQRGDLPRKGQAIAKASAIIGYLSDVLDSEAGGDIAANLSRLYAHLVQQLTQANLNNDSALLTRALELLQMLGSAWNEISSHQYSMTASR